LGIVRRLLKDDWKVTVSSRKQENVDKAARELVQEGLKEE